MEVALLAIAIGIAAAGFFAAKRSQRPAPVRVRATAGRRRLPSRARD